ncbi:MAG: Do family serine endopeptidase [Candidatus Kapabacteria bacterium]|nr:Do family serine endopeptidase [Candidatus Kapabacteria bacterium]
MNARLVKKIGIFALIGILIVGIVLSLNTQFGSHLFADDQIGASKPPVTINPYAKALNDALQEASKAVIPAVVSIKVEIDTKQQQNPDRDMFREFFRFFGDPFEDQGPREASGSGVIISESGYIVTNNHVIENASVIIVTTDDKKEHKAKLIGRDPLTDLAVIKIEGGPFPYVHFGNMDNVKVGEMVIAVGNPLGLNSTVTAGIISAIGRGGLALLRERSPYAVENFIQTDAAINPGNSGGGLFNLEGSLIGINTAIATRTGTYIGYGFAIPIDLVKSVVLDLIDDGKINRGYIGVQIRTIDEIIAKSVGLDKVEGVVVNDVVKKGPAEKAGIEPGDVILEIDGNKVATSNELQSFVAKKRAGDKVTLTIWRDGKKINKTVKLEPRDTETDTASDNAIPGEDESTWEDKQEVKFDKLGFTVNYLTANQKEDYKVDKGAFITRVERNSVAANRGMAPNGVIVKADKKEVASPRELKKLIDSKKSGDVVIFQIKYIDSNRIIAMEIQ